ncbi:MAG: hypothetical protein KA369_06610 [Spirochaetes bacterium]|nr:hypothetical protein [Spirochaetota bacterium]
MNLNKIIVIILSIFTLFLGSPLFAENKKMRIAIMDFSPKGISVKDSRTISELIRNDMINTGEYIVVERDQMNKILFEQGFQMTGCTEDSCAVQAGKLLSANKILVGSLIQLDEKIIITGRIVDVEKGSADFSEKIATESRSNLDATAERFVKRLTDRMLGKKPEPEKKTKYKTVIYTTGSGMDTYEQCGYSSLAFAIAACAAGIPAAVFQSRYSSAKWEYNNSKKAFNMTLVFSGTSAFQLYGLTQVLAMRNNLGDMKKNIRGRDASLYVMAGFGGISLIMAAATLGAYLNPESHAFLERIKEQPFSVYPSYYSIPAQDSAVACDHHINMTAYYRF